MGARNSLKIYIAGPLYTEGERWYLERIDQVCRNLGFETYLPHRDAGICPPSGEGGEVFFQADLQELREADLVVAVLNGQSIDPGTAWEMGFAYSRGCQIVGIFEDTRIHDPRANINLMIYYSTELCNTMNALEEKLRLFKARFSNTNGEQEHEKTPEK